jgi:hypothetical protein
MELFSAADCCECIALGFALAGMVFYPLAALLSVVKAFKAQ